MHNLVVDNLGITFHGDNTPVAAVQGVSFTLMPGETLGIVGESGSGKSATALAIMGLLPGAAQVTGQVWFTPQQITSNVVSSKTVTTPQSPTQPQESPAAVELITLQQQYPQQMRQYRGDRLAMVFQEPMTALNPLFTCGYQVMESLQLHQGLTAAAAKARVIELFERVKLPFPAQICRRYPHELSGGQLQRVTIAMAIACNPQILIADEPTTALDVTIQKEILDLLLELQQDDRQGNQQPMSMIFITHDLGVVNQVADQVAVMYKGRIVEYGSKAAIFEDPQHPYTKALIDCRPSRRHSQKWLPTVRDYMIEKTDGEIMARDDREPRLFEQWSDADRQTRREQLANAAPLLAVENLKVRYRSKGILGGNLASGLASIFTAKSNGVNSLPHHKHVEQYVEAVAGVSLEVRPGEVLGLVGESGCGKTSLSRAILGLVPAAMGKVQFGNRELRGLSYREMQRIRAEIQLIFQDPYGSLNPRMSVGEAIAEPLLIHQGSAQFARYRSRQVVEQRVAYLLRRVGLERAAMHRYPHEFSGGQRQRICIARALALRPKLIIADEPVSALDVSVQAQVLNLLKELQDVPSERLRQELPEDLLPEFDLEHENPQSPAYLFISHDLSVVRFMSDRIAVMHQGLIVEQGTPEEVLDHPQNEYTKKLLAAVL
ncbi:MAG: ABC transporter ATP-binding protein [Pseudanabaenaceae cyanobacterium]|jgi:peptide/nickel transport system ATP-binding protein